MRPLLGSPAMALLGSLALILAGVATTSADAPPPVTAQATASKAEVTIGESFAIEVKASGPAGTRFTFPAELIADTFELRTPPAAKGGIPSADPGVHRYEAAVFALGEARIPPIAVRYRLADGAEGEAATQEIDLRVASLLPKDPQQQKLADVRPPVTVSIGRAFWIALAVVLLLAGALIYWLLSRRRRARAPSATPMPETPPDLEALRALDALEASDLLARGELREMYIHLTAIAKRYLERRLRAPVLEMTTAETLAFLRSHAHGADLLAVVRDLALAADRVKFANAAGLREEAGRHLASVRSLVAGLEGRLRPPAVEARGKAA